MMLFSPMIRIRDRKINLISWSVKGLNHAVKRSRVEDDIFSGHMIPVGFPGDGGQFHYSSWDWTR